MFRFFLQNEQISGDAAEDEKIAIGRHASFTAHLKDGMSLSCSSYGQTVCISLSGMSRQLHVVNIGFYILYMH